MTMPLPPSIAQNAYRKQNLAMAQAAVDQLPIGEPVIWLEPQPRDKLDKTIERHMKRMGELAKDTWDQLYELETEKIKEADFYAAYNQHDVNGDLIVRDPFTGEDMIDPMTGEVVLGAFALALRDICAYQFYKNLNRYASIKKQKEREAQQEQGVFMEAA